MISLAGGLPLQWPEPVNVMFKTMATMSSAGTTLLVPDCELTHLRSADAFFMKQIFFTCTVPIIITICLSAWGCIRLTCGTKCCQLKKKDYKNYTILSIVLMTFLCYPTLVKLCLSMLKCVKVGDHRYLMADLQELCFSGQHLQYALMLSLPQFVLYILGLPILGFIIVHKNKKHLKRKDIRMRYGLLYMGYRKDREWWEIVIAIRKIAIVAIGTFGTFMGVVDLQAFIALLITFLSIITHLFGKPFDIENETKKKKGLLLHNLEFVALCVCWFTFWGGLLFYLGHERPDTVSSETRIVMTVILVLGNIVFVVIASYEFVKEFIRDWKHKEEVKRLTLAAGALAGQTSVVPINAINTLVEKDEEPDGSGSDEINNENQEEEEEEEEDDGSARFEVNTSLAVRRQSISHTTSTIHTALMVHDQFELHDEAFRSETKARQKKERRQTQNRVIARLRIRKTKALSKVPMFKKISPEVIESILECTTYEKHKAGDILCTQGDVATDFYIIVSGQCDIYVTAKAVDGDTQLPRKVGSLKDLDYFGENALLEGAKKRNATVKAESEYVQVLLLSRMNFELLVEGGLLTADILSTVTKESKRREELTRKSFEIVDETKTLEEEDCWAVLNE